MSAGTRVGPYELMSLAGAGGMGEVYRALDTRLHRTVAVKLLPAELATPARLRRFEQEARAASALNHPNILTIHDVGRDGDVPYLAMEWVEGRTLRALMNGERVSLPRVAEIAAQIADGLAKAHAAGIVHRDIKPENVMITDDGLVKIVDFGLATITDGADATGEGARVKTATAVTMGTVGYMSPEQASGAPADYRSDQFALGSLLYEMATRTRPFERATVAQSLAATIETEPAGVDALNPGVSPHLATIIGRCLAKAPADRYASTLDLARDLRSSVDDVNGDVPLGRPGRQRVVARAAVLTAMAACLAVFTAASTSRSNGPTANESEAPLVAVIPFLSVSPDEMQAFIAPGISHGLHGLLSRMSGVRVLGRAAAARYVPGDGPRLARELDVASVVEGSVHVDGSRVRVDVRLRGAQTQAIRWSETYDRDRAGILSVPNEMAARVLRALRVSVTPLERLALDRRPTTDPEAYLLYLHWQRTREDWEGRAEQYASLEPLRKAIALDPRFSEAKSALAFELALMGSIYDDADDYLREAVANAEDVLRIDPASTDAYDAIAVVHTVRGHAGLARLAFQRGITANPNDGSNMYNLSILEVGFGRFATSLEWARSGWALSGRRGNDYYHVAAPLSSLRDDDTSSRWLLDGERRYPTSPRLQQELALLELQAGRAGAAVARAKRSVDATPDNPEGVMALSEIVYLADALDLEAVTEPLMKESAGSASLWVGETARFRYAHALAARGQRRRAESLFAQAEQRARQRIDGGDETPRWRTELAAIAAVRGQHDLALDWLGRAYDAGAREYGILERDPAFVALRGHSRFLATLDAMRRDVAAQRQAAREKGLLDIDRLLAPARQTAR